MPNDNPATNALTTGQQDTDTITIKVDDNNGGNVTQDIVINITGENDAPVATSDTISTDEDISVTIDVLVNDSDAENDTLTVTDAIANNGTVVVNADGTLAYQGNQDFNGIDTITYTVSDGELIDIETVTVDVVAVNDLPILTSGAQTGFVIEDEMDTSSASGQVIVTDVEGVLNFTVTGGKAYGALTLDALDGTWTYSIDNTLTATQSLSVDEVVTEIYTITATDIDGESVTQDITITINGMNDVPVIRLESQTTGELTEDRIIIKVIGMVIATDVDSGDSLTYILDTSDQGVYGSISLFNTLTGQWHYTIDNDLEATQALAHGEQVTESFNVIVTDSKGASSAQEINITITGTNDVPVAADDAATTDEDILVNIDVLANDSDIDSDNLSVTAATAVNGTVTISTDGTLAYQGNQDFNGTDTITYTISDGNGGSATAVVDVVVKEVNDAPIATNDIATIKEDTMIIINVLDNDIDIEGDTLEVSIKNDAINGVVNLNVDGTLTYIGNQDFNGLDVITYTVSDGNGGSDTAIVKFNVEEVNDAPVITSDVQTGSLTEDHVMTTATGVVVATDVDGDELTYEFTNESAIKTTIAGFSETSLKGIYGDINLKSDGTWTYTINNTLDVTQALSKGTIATDRFIATVFDDDESKASDTQVINITILGSNETPVLLMLIAAIV